MAKLLHNLVPAALERPNLVVRGIESELVKRDVAEARGRPSTQVRQRRAPLTKLEAVIHNIHNIHTEMSARASRLTSTHGEVGAVQLSSTNDQAADT